MTNVKNELPVAVHMASGGDARVRTGGINISLHGVSSASFQVSGTKYKMCPSLRASGGSFVYVGYESPVGLNNAAFITCDMETTQDEVPNGTTVYVLLVSPMTNEPINGLAQDSVCVSFYD